MKINATKRILGIPLIWLLLAGVTSAAIIVVGVSTQMNVHATGYLDEEVLPPALARNFTVCDGDLNDSITFTINEGGEAVITFPVGLNKTILYEGVALITPFQDGVLWGTNVYRTNNGLISGIDMQISQRPVSQYNFPIGVPAGSVAAFSVDNVKAGVPLEFSFRAHTITQAQFNEMGLTPETTDEIHMKLEVK